MPAPPYKHYRWGMLRDRVRQLMRTLRIRDNLLLLLINSRLHEEDQLDSKIYNKAILGPSLQKLLTHEQVLAFKEIVDLMEASTSLEDFLAYQPDFIYNAKQDEKKPCRSIVH